MRPLIVISHPAHVHFFKNLLYEIEKEGGEPTVLVKERENTKELLDSLEIEYETFGRTYPDKTGKAFGVLKNDLSLLKKVSSLDLDVTMSIAGLYSAHVGSLLDVTTVDFTDTEGARLTNKVTFPFSNVIATPDCYEGEVPEKKHRRYAGYHELAYLHPDRFTPDDSIVKELDLEKKGYVVVRFSDLSGLHQEEEGILYRKQKIDLVKDLGKKTEVVLDTEGEIPNELERYRSEFPDHRYHDILAFSKMYIGEGATTASEAGVLGVPWLYLSKGSRSYLKEQENKYDLGKRINRYEEVLDTAEKVLDSELLSETEENREKMLEDKIDVTDWMLELIEDICE